MRILMLHGPNFNLLGRREPEIYGSETLKEIERRVQERAAESGCQLSFIQSNHEGVLLDALHEEYDRADGAIMNPGAFGHTSIALRDAVAAVPYPVIEVHLTNVYAREEFRQHLVIAPVARGQIAGLGLYGYIAAFDALVALSREG